MALITVYRWKFWDIIHDEYKHSERWGTLDAIEDARGTPFRVRIMR